MLPANRIPRAAWGTRLLLCLMLLAVSLRAMIPVGYMPDPAALRQGVVRISLCTAAGTVSVMQFLRDGPDESRHGHVLDAGVDHHDGHDHSGSGHAAGNECPFWAAAHLAADLPPLAIVPLLAAIRDQAVRVAISTALPTLPPAGPPLGSRAPPSA